MLTMKHLLHLFLGEVLHDGVKPVSKFSIQVKGLLVPKGSVHMEQSVHHLVLGIVWDPYSIQIEALGSDIA